MERRPDINCSNFDKIILGSRTERIYARQFESRLRENLRIDLKQIRERQHKGKKNLWISRRVSIE